MHSVNVSVINNGYLSFMMSYERKQCLLYKLIPLQMRQRIDQLSLRWEIKTRSFAKLSPGESYDQSDTTEGQFSRANLQFDVRLPDWIQFITKRFLSLALMKCKYLR